MTDIESDPDSIEILELLAPMWRRRWLIVVVVAIATVATYVYTENKPDQYQASTRIFLKTSDVDQSVFGGLGFTDSERNLTNQANLLQTPGVARAVARLIGFKGDSDALLGFIQVTPSADSDFLSITATSSNPRLSATVANGFARAFIDVQARKVRADVADALRSTRRQLAELPAQGANAELRSTLHTKISSLQAIDALAPGQAEQVDEAVAPSVRSAPRPRRAALFGFVLSLAFALLAAVGLERLDRRIRSLSQMGPAYRAPVIAALPHAPRGALSPKRDGPLRIVPELHESVRALRTNLRLAKIDEPVRTVVVTSAVPAEGKSTLVVNLALAYREAGLRVAIIECDLRRPAVADLLGLKPGPGLTETLAGEYELADVVQAVEVGADVKAHAAVAVGGHAGTEWTRSPALLTVLTSGGQPPDPTSVLATDRMREIIAQARATTDIVLIDTPPLLSVADGLPLLGMVDGILVVARIGEANRSSGRRLREVIARIPGADLLGIVVNDIPESDLGLGAYGYSYRYGATAKAADANGSRRT